MNMLFWVSYRNLRGLPGMGISLNTLAFNPTITLAVVLVSAVTAPATPKEYPAGAFAGMSKVKVWMTSPLSAAKFCAFSVTVTITPPRTKVRRAFCTAGNGKSDSTCR